MSSFPYTTCMDDEAIQLARRRRKRRLIVRWVALLPPLALFLWMRSLVSWRMDEFKITHERAREAGCFALPDRSAKRLFAWPGTSDGQYEIWDLAGQHLLRRLAPPTTPLKPPRGIASAALAPDGTRFALSSNDGVWLYTSATGAAQMRLFDEPVTDNARSYSPPSPRYTRLHFSPDGRQLVAVAEPHAGTDYVALWTLPTTTPSLGPPASTLPLPRIVRDNTGAARLTPNQRRRRAALAEGSALGFSPNGTLLAVSHSVIFPAAILSRIELYDARTLQLRRAWQTRTFIGGLVFSPDGATLASVGNNGGQGVCELYDTATAQRRYAVRGPGRYPHPPYSVAFSDDGTLLAVTGHDGYTSHIEIHVAATGALWREMEWAGRTINYAIFRPDNAALIAISDGDAVATWRVR